MHFFRQANIAVIEFSQENVRIVPFHFKLSILRPIENYIEQKPEYGAAEVLYTNIKETAGFFFI